MIAGVRLNIRNMLSRLGSRALSDGTMVAGTEPVALPEMPYEYSALEPYISAEIMELHHSKHHQTYVNSYNKALEMWNTAQSSQDSRSVPQIASALHFHGGGHVNHSIFWKNLCPAKVCIFPEESTGIEAPDADAAPIGESLMTAIERDFGGLEALKKQMNSSAAGIQGSGWTWLATKPVTGKLYVVTSANQDTLEFVSPVLRPILGIDMWEHAYYLQYKNVKPDYLSAIWHVVNWGDVSARYMEAMKGKLKSSEE